MRVWRSSRVAAAQRTSAVVGHARGRLRVCWLFHAGSTGALLSHAQPVGSPTPPGLGASPGIYVSCANAQRG